MVPTGMVALATVSSLVLLSLVAFILAVAFLHYRHWKYSHIPGPKRRRFVHKSGFLTSCRKGVPYQKKTTFEFLSVKGLLSCLDIVEKIDIREWMLHDRLMQNDTKTEFIVLGSKQQLSKVIIPHITLMEQISCLRLLLGI